MPGGWFDTVVAGIKYPSIAGFGFFMYRIVVFGCNFLAGRFDVRQARVEALDERLNISLSKRLDHLERAERTNQQEIQMLRGWVTALASELRSVDPENPRLKGLTDALIHGIPVPPPDHGIDSLLSQARESLDRSDKR